MLQTPSLLIYLLYLTVVLSNRELYNGTSFPRKYFVVETLVPTTENLESYLLGAKRVLAAISEGPNQTDPNRALGVFYMKSILKRTVLENGRKLSAAHNSTIKEIIKDVEWLLGHYFYKLQAKKKKKPAYVAVVNLFRDDSVQTETIRKFNRNHLAHWLVKQSTVNNFAKQFDELTLSKEKYALLVNSISRDVYVINVDKSDECLSEIEHNKIYFDKIERPCTASKSCADILYNSPSVAYSLSHRLFNLAAPRQLRRCYMRSKEEDDKLMEMLCAQMYRETVYLARRGYFFRDLFMEHIALCGFLGYREFFRLHWFKKALSWIDDNGCIKENMNFEHLRIKIFISKAKTEKRRNHHLKVFREIFNNPCSYHQMALSLIMFAHGVRYAAEFMV